MIYIHPNYYPINYFKNLHARTIEHFHIPLKLGPNMYLLGLPTEMKLHFGFQY